MILVGSTKVVTAPGPPSALLSRAGFAVDADGAPDAYGPDNSGLDYTANAGHPAREVPCPVCGGHGVSNFAAATARTLARIVDKIRLSASQGDEAARVKAADVDQKTRAGKPLGEALGEVACERCAGSGRVHQAANWWGVETDTGSPDGTPVVQGMSDPAPGYYVSTTALCDPNHKRMDPRRYVDASRVPYASVPPGVVKLGARVGDVGVACLKTDDGVLTSAFIIADVGPRDSIGEGSPALAWVFGLDASPRDGGTNEKKVVWVVFPGSRGGLGTTVGRAWPRANDDVAAQASDLLVKFGGYEKAVEALV